MQVLFIDLVTKQEWSCQLDPLPHKGDEVFLWSAPKGVLHAVNRILHRIGGGEHVAWIYLDQIRTDHDEKEDRERNGLGTEFAEKTNEDSQGFLERFHAETPERRGARGHGGLMSAMMNPEVRAQEVLKGISRVGASILSWHSRQVLSEAFRDVEDAVKASLTPEAEAVARILHATSHPNANFDLERPECQTRLKEAEALIKALFPKDVSSPRDDA